MLYKTDFRAEKVAKAAIIRSIRRWTRQITEFSEKQTLLEAFLEEQRRQEAGQQSGIGARALFVSKESQSSVATNNFYSTVSISARVIDRRSARMSARKQPPYVEISERL